MLTSFAHSLEALPAEPRLDDAAMRFVHAMAAPTFALDTYGRVVVWNTACERLTRVSSAQILGTPDHRRAFHAIGQPCLADLLSRELGNAKGEGASTAAAWCAVPLVGREHYLTFDASPVHDAAGNLAAVAIVVHDQTRQQRAMMASDALATHDAVTRLPNRASFDRLVRAQWERAEIAEWPLSLLSLEIDCFKLYVDGRGQGDECLRIVADLLEHHLRHAADFLARVGNDKFAVVLPDTAMGVAAEIAEEVRQAIVALRLPHPTSTVAPFISVSVGIASGTGLDTRLEQLLADADAALMRAKREGHNRCSASRAGVAISVVDAYDDRPTSREALRRRRDLTRGQ